MKSLLVYIIIFIIPLSIAFSQAAKDPNAHIESEIAIKPNLGFKDLKLGESYESIEKKVGSYHWPMSFNNKHMTFTDNMLKAILIHMKTDSILRMPMPPDTYYPVFVMYFSKSNLEMISMTAAVPEQELMKKYGIDNSIFFLSSSNLMLNRYGEPDHIEEMIAEDGTNSGMVMYYYLKEGLIFLYEHDKLMTIHLFKAFSENEKKAFIKKFNK